MSAATGLPVLRVAGFSAWYRVDSFGITREVHAVDDISLEIAGNEIYGLAGESSCGKSTLVKAIAGAVRPPLRVVAGRAVFEFGGAAVDMNAADPTTLDRVRWRHLSYIVQGSMNVLNPVRRVRQAFVDFAFRHIGGSMANFVELVRGHLLRLHLNPEVLEAFPHELSGGMRQRVTIALATICRPDFIIADEPTTALDVVVQKGVLGLLGEVQRKLGSSLLLVTHDLAVHATLCDRIGIMYAGRLVEEGPTEAVFRTPLHPYTAHLIASLPRIGDTGGRQGLEGRPPNLADPPKGCRFHPRCPLAMPICRDQVPAMLPAGPWRRVACFAAIPGRVV
ncbi:MAG TPA: ABC transporter ATP-binding protein [Acetobacteraceae bacterium]|nr:ABC transporter ATP-binding protein [Acetobacteraceae bacterium]